MNNASWAPQHYYAHPHPAQQQGIPVVYNGGSPYTATGEIHVDPTVAHGLPHPPADLHDPTVGDALGVDDDDDGTGDGGGGNKKKGGRPRDKVWELFDGDRDVAKCRYCQWKTDHPKAFRMRTHVAACDMIPQDKKDDMARWQEEKEQKKAVKAEHADALGSNSPAAPQKKVKRDHNGEIIVGTSSAIKPKMAAPVRKSPITCHVLDSTSGKPAAEMRIRLDRLNTTGFVLQAQGVTDTDGRCSNLLPSTTKLDVGIYKITFFSTDYFNKRGILSFYPFIEIPFEVKSAEEHYHIPCLLSPYSYTTYRGS
ncbi:hypothetical protein JCM10207_001399 [Rhodosporidiobolus poonsookiae]